VRVGARGETRPVLIVDGDAGFRMFASRLFLRAGFPTSEAVTGAQALERARKTRPLLILSEVCLSDISGFEVCRALRDEFGDGLPIIFVSGKRTDPLDRATGLLVGGDDYLVKPANPDELLARVARLISRRRRGHATWSRARDEAELTERELEVLRLLADGVRPKEIAIELVISPKTVASHIQNITGKLGVQGRAEAVAVAYRQGFVRPLASAGDGRGRLTT
jgi:DNA-binding NarL/FixJ family response regulator